MLVLRGCLILTVVLFSVIKMYAKAPVLTAAELASPPSKIIRTCCSYGSNLGILGMPFIKRTDITSLEFIGPHQFLGSTDEGNGIIYTKRGGFIDLGHVRDCADWTAYLYNLILASQFSGDTLTMELGKEGGGKTLVLAIPQSVRSDELYELAGAIAYDLSLWHEISTWFGASYIPLVPERYSSFSPEDLYSNLLGVSLGIEALKSDLEYDAAMTVLLDQMLADLESVTTYDATFQAMGEVENVWWTGEKALPSKKILLRRYLDSETELEPWLVSDTLFQADPYVLIKPLIDTTALFEFQIRVNYKFPLKAIIPSKDGRVVTQQDFYMFMAYIKTEVDALELKLAERSEHQQARKERRHNG